MKLQKDENFRKELFVLAVPFALQALLSSLVGASDALMLGRLSQDAVSAVSLANQISFVMSLFTSGIVGAASALCAQYYGKGDDDMVRKLLSMAIRFSFLISVVFFALAFFIPEQLMMIFTNETELIHIGASYLRIVSFSFVFMGMSQCYFMLMKMDGRAKVSVYISVATVLVDMVIDFFLIYGIGSVPALGADGSAYSTIVVEIVAFIWVVAASFEKGRIHPTLKSLTFFSADLEKDMLKIEIPMWGSALAWGLSIAAHSSIIGHLGRDMAAAYAVTNVATSLVQCLSHGFASGFGIMIGGLLGKNELEKAKNYGHRSWIVAAIIGFVNIVLVAVTGSLVYIFYVLEPAAKHILIIMIAYNMLYMFAYSFNTIFTCGVFPAGGDAKYDAISVFIATWCIAIPLSILGAFVFHWPAIVVYFVMCFDEIGKFPFLIPRYKQYIWLKNLTREEV